MSRLIAVVGVYGLVLTGCTGAGLFMLIVPARFGNMLHNSFGLFPEVHPGDAGKKLILRAAGTALLAFAARFAWAVADGIR